MRDATDILELVSSDTSEERRAVVMERFLAEELFKAGVWSSERVSDGMAWVHVKARTATSVSLCGRIWEIVPNECHSFWLDVESDSGWSRDVRWTLFYDVMARSSQEKRLAEIPSAFERPDQLEWRFRGSGHAHTHQG